MLLRKEEPNAMVQYEPMLPHEDPELLAKFIDELDIYRHQKEREAAMELEYRDERDKENLLVGQPILQLEGVPESIFGDEVHNAGMNPGGDALSGVDAGITTSKSRPVRHRKQLQDDSQRQVYTSLGGALVQYTAAEDPTAPTKELAVVQGTTQAIV